MSIDASNTSKQAEQEFGLILEAKKEFDKANYEVCLEMLNQLEIFSSCINTGKLQHNRAIVKFYKTSCKEYTTLLQTLNELDNDEVVENSTAGAPLIVNGVAYPIAKYNKAVIYFHRHMYRTAINALAPLIPKLESLEPKTATLVATLMLRLLLNNNQLNKAMSFLEFVKGKLNLGTSSSATSTALPSEESSLSKLPASMDSLSRNFKLLEVLTNIINGNPAVIPDDGTIEFSVLKAHQYYLLKDFQMAAKQLMKINTITLMENTRTDELNTCIANNMGIIHLRVRHYALAAKFFQNAINFDKKIAANVRNSSIYELSAVRSCEILYNLGISMLYLRRPKEAFQCFLVPLKSYHSNPRLWLRMAEACIMDHEMKIVEDEANRSRADTAKSRPPKQYSTSGQSAAVPEPNLEFAAISLRNALTLSIFYKQRFSEVDTENESVDSESRDWLQSKDNNFCNPSTNISKESLENMLASIYAAYSYVSLRLGDYVMALEMAQNLLKTEKLSDAHRLLGHMYASEALMMINKLPEALPHLEPTFVASLNAFDFETKDWQLKSLDAAQTVVRYNLAVANVMQGDLERADFLLKSCTHPIVAVKKSQLRKFINSNASGYM